MNKKILLADDSITIQKVIELTFSDEDFDVIAVGNGRLAMEKALDVRPDVVLCDIIMPEKDGYEVCEFIKTNPLLSDVPVLLLTGAFEPFDQDKAARVGCDGFLAKPFEPQTLINKVKDLLNQRGARPAVPPVTRPGPQPFSPVSAPPPAPAPALGSRPAASTWAPPSPFSSGPESVSAPAVARPAEPFEPAAANRPEPEPLSPWAPPPEAPTVNAFSAASSRPTASAEEPAETFLTDEPFLEDEGVAGFVETMEDLEPGPPDSYASPAAAEPLSEEEAAAEELVQATPDEVGRVGSGEVADSASTVMFSAAPAWSQAETEVRRETPALADVEPPLPQAETAAFEEVFEEEAAEVLLATPPESATGFEEAQLEGIPVEAGRDVPPEAPARLGAAAEAGTAARLSVKPSVAETPRPSAGPAEASFADVSAEVAPAAAASLGAPAPSSDRGDIGVPVDMVEKIAQRVVAQISEKVIREIAWEIIPELAEALIKKEIERLKDESQRS